MYLAPFASGVQVLGVTVYFLAMLIISSRLVKSETSFWIRNVITGFSLLFAIALGNILGISSIANVGYTFAVIWAVEKFGELRWWNGANWVIFIFLLSIGLYFTALFLNTHPGWIVGLFDSSYLL